MSKASSTIAESDLVILDDLLIQEWEVGAHLVGRDLIVEDQRKGRVGQALESYEKGFSVAWIKCYLQVFMVNQTKPWRLAVSGPLMFTFNF